MCHVDVSDGELVIDGRMVVEQRAIGHGSQYSVLLVRTEDGYYYLVEVGVSGSGQYAVILSELLDVDMN